MKRCCAAYTLLEVLIAAAILMLAVAAAAALCLATVTQEEITAHVSRCLNLHEQAVRLYQLGLPPETIPSILPPDSSLVSLTFTTQNLSIPNLGTVEEAYSTLVFTTTPLSSNWVGGMWSGGENSSTARRTNTITAIRPSIR